jgi:hypothetical protein
MGVIREQAILLEKTRQMDAVLETVFPDESLDFMFEFPVAA